VSKLLIIMPSKTGQLYKDRIPACENTWLKNCPCDYKFLSDADMGLVEIDQYDQVHDPIRTLRMIGMATYAYARGYDHMFRCDTDTYVWINRLLASGFEQHDYMGYCLEYPGQETIRGHATRTAHGGDGFFLSRRAMEIIKNAKPHTYYDGKYWGDMWTGDVLWRHGIHCKRDTRFMDGSGYTQHHGNIFAHELPLDHPYIAVHPVPAENMQAIYDRFPMMPAETVAPRTQLWHTPSGR
jgi:hypothetical protein